MRLFLRHMRFGVFFTLSIVLIVFWSSCRKDFEYQESTGNLAFSKDTVFLDTIFTNIGSSTYSLKVYNRTKNDILIPSISLGQGQSSTYRLNVDGVAGKNFENIPILAKDSIFIFIETTFDITDHAEKEFLHTDVIQFNSKNNTQEIPLITLIRDAVFLYPTVSSDKIIENITLGTNSESNEVRLEGFVLSDGQLHFTNEKPYVIYGYATVPPERELLVDSGARIYFHQDSGILVKKNASIHINGALSADEKLLENDVIFEGDRLEPEFDDISGQWGGVYLLKGSTNNTIDYLSIKNAGIGLFVEGDSLLETPTLTLKNSQIYNSQSINLWAKTAAIIAENVVFGGSGDTSLYCNLGGNYTFTHCTIANYWKNGFRNGAALHVDNFLGDISADLVQADFINCIIDGNNTNELSLKTNNARAFNFSFINCMITFGNDVSTSDPIYDFKNTSIYKDILLNQEADFTDATNNNFTIGANSAANGAANNEGALNVPLDIRGIDRTTTPDIGAYESFIKN